MKMILERCLFLQDTTEILTSFPSRSFCPLVMVASTVAACSPPITEILAFGHMYKNRGLETEIVVDYKPHA